MYGQGQTFCKIFTLYNICDRHLAVNFCLISRQPTNQASPFEVRKLWEQKKHHLLPRYPNAFWDRAKYEGLRMKIVVTLKSLEAEKF